MTKLFTGMCLALLTVACSRVVDPCPPGSRSRDEQGLCVMMPAANAPDASTDAGDSGPVDVPGEPGKPLPGDGEPGDGEPGDGEPGDGEPGDGDLGEDASVDSGLDAGSDAGGDAATPDGGGGEDMCEAEDVDRWKEFHTAGGIVSKILTCLTSDPSCASGSCELDVCLKDGAGVVGCDACVAAEVMCVARQCATPCGANGSDDACLACACEEGCTERFASCAGSEFAVCECSDASCVDSTLSPALIMAILHPVLNALPVMVPP